MENYIQIIKDYNTDFSNLKEGSAFPPISCQARNKKYRFNMKLYDGSYANNKKLIAWIDGMPKLTNYKVIPTYKFETVVNKLDSLLFGQDLTITTGDIERDRIVNRLVDKTMWVKGIRQAVKYAEIYGDSYIKTGVNGVSVFPPMHAYKVVDSGDKNKVIAYVLYEILYNKISGINGNDYTPSNIRIIISCKGCEFERVYEYNGSNYGGTLGKAVDYVYKDRTIPSKGKWYETTVVDCETVQMISVNTTKNDAVYGCSALEPVKDIIFAIENRLSTENWVIDAHGKPLMLVSQQMMKTNEKTGEYYLSVVNDKYIVQKGIENSKPEYLTWDGKLESSKQLRDDLEEEFFSLTEMGRTFLTGEYQGNISEESLNNIIKGAIDRGLRDLNDVWYDIIKSLYVMCKLNNIDINIEDININFNIGRVDDMKTISSICETLNSMKLLSKKTLLNKFFGYNDEMAEAEMKRIEQENNLGGKTE